MCILSHKKNLFLPSSLNTYWLLIWTSRKHSGELTATLIKCLNVGKFLKQIDLGVKVCLEYFKYLSIILIEVEWCSAMFSRCNQAKNILYLIFSIITILQFEIYQAKFCLYFEKSCEFIATPHQSNEQGWIGKRKKTWFVKKTISSPKNT